MSDGPESEQQAEPAAHLKQGIVLAASAKINTRHKAFKSQASGELIAADRDDLYIGMARIIQIIISSGVQFKDLCLQ